MMPASVNARVDARDLLDGDALLHELEQAIGRDLEPAAHRDAAGAREQLAQLGREASSRSGCCPTR